MSGTMWDRFDEALKARGMKQYELVEKLGLAETRISKWKSKTENFSVDDAVRISETLGLDLSYWLGGAKLAETFTPEERGVVAAFRASRLTFEEAVEVLLAARRSKEADTPSPASGRKAGTS